MHLKRNLKLILIINTEDYIIELVLQEYYHYLNAE